MPAAKFGLGILGLTQPVQLVGNAYQDEPDVGYDGEQHLAQRLRLLHGQRFAGLPVLGQRELIELLYS